MAFSHLPSIAHAWKHIVSQKGKPEDNSELFKYKLQIFSAKNLDEVQSTVH